MKGWVVDKVKACKKTALILTITLFAKSFVSAFDVMEVHATSSTQQQIQQEENEKAELENRLDENQKKGGTCVCACVRVCACVTCYSSKVTLGKQSEQSGNKRTLQKAAYLHPAYS